MDASEVLPRDSSTQRAIRAAERSATETPLRFALLAVLLLLAAAIAILRPGYDTNDDVFMTMIAAGQGFCPAPDEHLIFTNVLVGQALKTLYTAWPAIPWYGCYLLAIHFAAQVAILYCTLTTDLEPTDAPAAKPTGGGLKRFALYLLYFALVELLFLNNLQFTTTAFLAAQGGVFLLLLAICQRARQPQAAIGWKLFTAVLLLTVAALVRLESLMMALLVAAPLALLLPLAMLRRALVPGAVAVVSAGALIGLAVAYNQATYEQDPRWRDFFSYNQVRVKFNDYGWTSYSPRTAPAFSAVGWTENDHAMIAHWFFDEPRLYSEEHLRSILAAVSWKSERLNGDYFRPLYRGLLRDRSVWALLLVLPFFFYQARLGRRAKRAILGSALMGIALVAFLTWNNKVPPARVYFPLLSFPLGAALLLAASWARGVRPVAWNFGPQIQHWARTVTVLVVVGLVMGVYHQGRRSLLVERDRRAFATFLKELHPSGRELYVCWEAAMPFELISPLDNLRSWSQIPLVNLVWTQRTPWQEEVKRRFGVSDLGQALCRRDDLVLVATPEHRALFAQFAKEHYQLDVEFLPSATVGAKLVAGRFQPRTQPAATANQQPSLPQR